MQTLRFIAYFKLLMRSLVFVSVPYLALFILFTLVIESPLSWGSMITQSLGFGVITTFAIGTQRNKHASYRPSPNAKHIANDRFESTMDIDALSNVLKNDPYFRDAIQHVFSTSVVLITEPSFSGWGETIKIVSATQIDNSPKEYEVTSSPMLKSTFLDRRKNMKNIDRLKALLENKNGKL